MSQHLVRDRQDVAATNSLEITKTLYVTFIASSRRINVHNGIDQAGWLFNNV